MQTALARHDALLRQVIERHSGHVVKTTGDGACAAFAFGDRSFEASVAAQQALGAEPWPDAVRIGVRIALHSGPGGIWDGDYFGPTLNRAARLLALGHGGQMLVSAITHDLCRDYLPPNVSLKSLGEHTKDLDRREDVFEVRHTESLQIFPPLRTLLASIDADTPSIAVLPFVNVSRDEENEYFADGCGGAAQRSSNDPRRFRSVAHVGIPLQRQGRRHPDDRAEAERGNHPRGQRAQGGQSGAGYRAAH